MRFQVRGVIGEQRVGGGVRFVEAVAGKLCHEIENLFDLLRREFALRRAFDKALALLRHFFGFLFAHGAAQKVGFAERVACQAVRDLHHLFLIDDHAQRFLQNFFELRQFVLDFLAAVLAVDKVVDHAALNRAGAVKRIQRGEVFDRVRADICAARRACRGFKLEDAGGQSLVKNFLIGLGVFERKRFERDRHAACLLRSASERR